MGGSNPSMFYFMQNLRLILYILYFFIVIVFSFYAGISVLKAMKIIYLSMFGVSGLEPELKADLGSSSPDGKDLPDKSGADKSITTNFTKYIQ